MASNSEATLGAKVTNAEAILTNIKNFEGYAPSDDELLPTQLETLVTNTKTKNSETALALDSYSKTVDTRQKLFQKNPDSLTKIMSPVAASVRSAFGKTSKEAVGISGMVSKIRGIKVKKPDKKPTEDSVSQSERSFGSMTQNFSDLITTLTNYGDKYKPANDSIKLPKLQEKLTQLTAANISVTTTFGQLKEKRDDRAELYKQLTNITQRIKDAVKSQYGLKSTEYNLIKGLKV